MKSKILAMSGLVAILGAGTAYSIHAQTPPAPALSPMGHAERHPEIRRAMKALVNAEISLKKADKDFAGHREKALDLTHQAIEECRAALAADPH